MIFVHWRALFTRSESKEVICAVYYVALLSVGQRKSDAKRCSLVVRVVKLLSVLLLIFVKKTKCRYFTTNARLFAENGRYFLVIISVDLRTRLERYHWYTVGLQRLYVISAEIVTCTSQTFVVIIWFFSSYKHTMFLWVSVNDNFVLEKQN